MPTVPESRGVVNLLGFRYLRFWGVMRRGRSSLGTRKVVPGCEDSLAAKQYIARLLGLDLVSPLARSLRFALLAAQACRRELEWPFDSDVYGFSRDLAPPKKP
jgi:hypothetical protein